jgi:3-dehydroquinate synthetase
MSGGSQIGDALGGKLGVDRPYYGNLVGFYKLPEVKKVVAVFAREIRNIRSDPENACHSSSHL